MDVYHDRILRVTSGRDAVYSTKKLGAVAADLGAVTCFFEEPWKCLSPQLSKSNQAWLLNEAAYRLGALGRLTEALEPMRIGLDMAVAQENWRNAAISANNLSELELTLGQISDAVRDAGNSVDYADRSGDAFQRVGKRTSLADALHQAGRRPEASKRFSEAEKMLAKVQPEYHLLYSRGGFQYCDLLLSELERAAWQARGMGFQPMILPPNLQPMILPPDLHPKAPPPDSQRTVPSTSSQSGSDQKQGAPATSPDHGRDAHATFPNHGRDARATLISRCREVEERAAQALKWAQEAPEGSLLDIALDHLTLGRATLYRAELTDSMSECDEALQTARQHLAAAVDGLRAAGTTHHLPRALLSRAHLRFVEGDPDAARDDLDEAWRIAERGPMRLHMADVQLHRARLFHDKAALAAAAALIAECGYHRRDGELADAQSAAAHW